MRRLVLTLGLSAAILVAGALVPERTASGPFGAPVPADCCVRG